MGYSYAIESGIDEYTLQRVQRTYSQCGPCKPATASGMVRTLFTRHNLGFLGCELSGYAEEKW